MTKVRDLMSTDVAIVAPGLTLRAALELFATRHIGGAPVMAGSRVVGVVSLSDISSFEPDRPGVVHMALECRLDLQVLLGRDLEGSDEQTFELLWHSQHTLERSPRNDRRKDAALVQASGTQLRPEERVHLLEHLPSEHLRASVGQGEHRLDPGAGTGQNADRAGWRNGRPRGIAQSQATSVVGPGSSSAFRPGASQPARSSLLTSR